MVLQCFAKGISFCTFYNLAPFARYFSSFPKAKTINQNLSLYISYSFSIHYGVKFKYLTAIFNSEILKYNFSIYFNICKINCCLYTLQVFRQIHLRFHMQALSILRSTVMNCFFNKNINTICVIVKACDFFTSINKCMNNW